MAVIILVKFVEFVAALVSFWRETSPAGATQESPGRKPWEQAQ